MRRRGGYQGSAPPSRWTTRRRRTLHDAHGAIDVDDRGAASAVGGRDVREDGPVLLPRSAVLVDVAEEVQARSHDRDARAEVRASLAPMRRDTVAVAGRRSVRY